MNRVISQRFFKKSQKIFKKVYTIIEMKNTLEGIYSRLNDTEQWISELEDKVVEINQAVQKKEKKNKKVTTVERPLEYIKYSNICIIGVPEREKEAENIFEDIIAENFHNLGKKTDIQVRKHRESQTGSPKRTTPRHIVIQNGKT